MSARRSRMKAVVTSFPARRKDKEMIPEQQQKETVEKPRAEPSQESVDVESRPMEVDEAKSKETMQGVINTVPFDFSDDKEMIPEQQQKQTVEKPRAEPSQESVDVESRPMEVDEVKSKETMQGVINTVPFDFSDDDFIASLFTVPDSTNEGNVMDGIVPLQAVSSAPKPDDLLNEIISENAEVLFDPIVPLPAPAKVRPKLRPVPRLAPLRKSSVQASVSEAEDDSRRALLSGDGPSTSAAPQQGYDSHDSPRSAMHSLPNRGVKRIRDESVSSNDSQASPQPGPSGLSSVKDKHLSKSQRVGTPRRVAPMRRVREAAKKEPLTMYDFIFTNPKTNPIVPDEAQSANEKEEATRKAAIAQGKNKEAQTEMEINVAPVPQIKLGPDGKIILDEQSLVIKPSEKRKVSSTVVHEGPSTASTSCGYRYTKRTAVWKDTETLRFYRAVSSMGTDFMLMENLFPERTRRDLKLKYKYEERTNMAQLEKALRTSTKFDPTRLENEFRAERMEEEKAEEESKELTIESKRLKRNAQRREARKRVPKSLAAKVFGESVMRIGETTRPSQSATTSRVKSKDMAILPAKTPKLPTNLTEGSIVISRYKDADCPSERKMLTLVAKAGGILSPVTLPPKFVKGMTTYMKTGVMPNYMSAVSAESAGSSEPAGSSGSAEPAGSSESAGSSGSAESAGSAASPSNAAANEDSRPCPTDPTPAVR